MSNVAKQFVWVKSCFWLCIGLNSAVALELGVDAALSSSPIVNGWGVSSHVQIIHDSKYGIDAGYRYFSDLDYQSASYGPLTQPRLQQYEASLLRQFGDKGVRFQALVGPIWSGDTAELNSNNLIQRFDLGYHADLGVSVPVFNRFRAFAEVGYQGWFDTELPSHVRWRYGLRMLFGQSTPVAARAEQQPTLSEPPHEDSTVIDERVPRYIPRHLSESLPPIVELAEVCRCFPAGPYTLQLGEFANLNQAMRALEFRGLRQFFNSRAFERQPQPVFLAQVDERGGVALYLGEMPSIEAMEYWRRELQKSGISARMRKVLNAEGRRIENPMMGVDVQLPSMTSVYSAEEIRRMNSLPATEAFGATASNEVIAEAPSLDVQALNRLDSDLQTQPFSMPVIQLNIDDQSAQLLRVGPIGFSELGSLLADDHVRRMLSLDPHSSLPGSGILRVDETEQQAWLYLGRFPTLTALDHWRVVFESLNVGVEQVIRTSIVVGDTTEFALAETMQAHTIVIARASSAAHLMAILRSAEVLWFDAFAKVNRLNVGMGIRWSGAEQVYQLVSTGIISESQRRLVLDYLVSVGLLPNLNESN